MFWCLYFCFVLFCFVLFAVSDYYLGSIYYLCLEAVTRIFGLLFRCRGLLFRCLCLYLGSCGLLFVMLVRVFWVLLGFLFFVICLFKLGNVCFVAL